MSTVRTLRLPRDGGGRGVDLRRSNRARDVFTVDQDGAVDDVNPGAARDVGSRDLVIQPTPSRSAFQATARYMAPVSTWW